MKLNKIGGAAALLAAAVTLSACAGTPQSNAAAFYDEQNVVLTVETPDAQKLDAGSAESPEAFAFSTRDLSGTYDASGAARLTFNGASISSSSDAATVSGSVATITAAGTYVLSGTLDNGYVVVDAGKEDKVQLVLNGVSIRSDTFAAIYVKQADKVFITLADGTENTLSNGGTFETVDENKVDGVIFSKDDLTLNGNGKLTVNSPAKHGVVCKDDLAVTGGVYEITAASHALSAKDSLGVAGGTLALVAGKDGIHAENDEDEAKGGVYIADGTITITADDDGVSASGRLRIDGGTVSVQAGGGAKNAKTASDDSRKGLKADGDLFLNGGKVALDTADDGVHSDANVSITAGEYAITAGDDGVHAEKTVSVSGGALAILNSYEGIEGLTILISDGSVSVVSSDDGLNATGGGANGGRGGMGMFRGRGAFDAESSATVNPSSSATSPAFVSATETAPAANVAPSLTISGGEIRVNSEGDGLDSNGNLTISGGAVYVSGTTRSGNGALDYDGSGVITGGVLIATGPAGMGQNQNFGASSTQGAIMATVGSQKAGSVITLTDKDGKELLRWTAEKDYGCVNVSSPEIAKDGTYTLKAGDYSETVTMSGFIYGAGGGMGGMGGGRMGRGFTGDAANGAPPTDGSSDANPPFNGNRPFNGTDENGAVRDGGFRGGKGNKGGKQRGAAPEQSADDAQNPL